MTQGVGHGHVHYKVLPEIITLKAVVLPVDSEILYKQASVYISKRPQALFYIIIQGWLYKIVYSRHRHK